MDLDTTAGEPERRASPTAIRNQDESTDRKHLGGRDSVAAAINDEGAVVGTAQTSTSADHGFVERHGRMIDLNSLIRADSGIVITNARESMIAARSPPRATRRVPRAFTSRCSWNRRGPAGRTGSRRGFSGAESAADSVDPTRSRHALYLAAFSC
jgi:probable HAF family extracellular repeat protein